MYIEKCSASAVNTYTFCNFQYYMEYVLGMESLSGKAAVQGSIAHQVFEWIALLNMRGKRLPEDWLIDQAYQMHTAMNPQVEIKKTTSRGEAADYKKIRVSIEKVIDHPIFNPWNLKIIQAEKKFVIEMPGPHWQVRARDGSTRQFQIRGVFDIVHEIDQDTIEIVDWKTGAKKDWRTLKDLDFYDLMRAIQPRFYHFAATYLFPQYKNILLTFYYMNDGGPETLPFSVDDVVPTVASMWQFYDAVRRDGTMRRNRSWKCKSFCSFGRNQVCDSVWGDLHALGQDYVELKYRGMTAARQRETTGLV